METLRINYDYWWKKLTTEFTPEFIQFFFSVQFYNQIDWTHPPEYLEQELTAAFTDSKATKKITDKLIRLKMKDGKVKFVFVHIEFQGKSGKAFVKRMFWYYVYIMSKYKTTDITAVVIYTGDNVTKVYDRFESIYVGTEMRFIFNTYVVSAQNEADLLKSSNPLAIAVLANLYVVQTRNELDKRAEYKKKLFELAKLKGYDREKTERLLTFVLYLMQLPKELEAEMKSFFNKNKKTSNMTATTEIKPKKEKRLSANARFIRDLSYEFAYGKSYEEIYDILYNQTIEDATEAITKIKEEALLKNKEAIQQMEEDIIKRTSALMVEQSKELILQKEEETITTMFQKTGWTADKIADISGFSIELVQRVVDKLKG